VSAVKKIWKTLLGIGSLMISIRPALAQPTNVSDASMPLAITVRVHDYVRVPRETLVRGEAESSRILRQAGVDVTWLNCDYSALAEYRDPPCSGPLGPVDLIMNVVERIQLLSPHLRDIAMGLSVVPSHGKPGDTAYLSMQQIASVSTEASLPVERILALGATHELGHLLLGENAHTATGLMKARWGSEDLALGAQGKLLFSPKQSERIRKNVLARQRRTAGLAASTRTQAITLADAVS
jgi:hypothetical protein